MTDITFDIITCIYCGEPGRDRHHYKESVANSGQKRSYRKGETLPACRECNLLIGSLTPTFTETCYLLYDKVSDRHKKVLSIPNWEKDDLAELAIDELQEIIEISSDDASMMIMKAREHWFN